MRVPLGPLIARCCHGGLLAVGLALWPAISADRTAAQDVLQRAEAVRITAGFASFLQRCPWLLEGGGEVCARDGGWVAIGVGGGLLVDERDAPIPLNEAQRVARVNADRELAKALHGVVASAKDQTELAADPGNERGRLREIFRSVSREEVEATLRRVEVVGTWRVKDSPLVCTMVAVGNPDNPLFAAPAAGGAVTVRFRNVQLEERWRNVLRTRVGILTGGAMLYRQGDQVCIVSVGKAALTGDPLADRNKDLVASANAGKEALQFLQGLKLQSTAETTLEHVRLADGERTVFEDIRAELRTVTVEKVLGLVRGQRPLGSWESPDGQFYYAAFQLDLRDLK